MNKDELAGYRQSSGYDDVGTPEDGAIVSMDSINGKLIIVKTKSIYELQFADRIDPKRENKNLPKTIQKRISSYGSESSVVRRVYLLGKNLINSDYLTEDVDIDQLHNKQLEYLEEISGLSEDVDEFNRLYDSECNNYNNQDKSGSYKVPSIPNLNNIVKGIYQKVDHCLQILTDIAIVYYSNLNLHQQSKLNVLIEKLEGHLGADDSLVKRLKYFLPTINLMRSLRNCLDHRLDHATVNDFIINADGTISSPTISLRNYRGSQLPLISLQEVLNTLLENCLILFEDLVAFMSARKVDDTRGYYPVVEVIPLEKRKYPDVKYSYKLPFGPDGYYDQK